jgi:hypothetical protein
MLQRLLIVQLRWDYKLPDIPLMKKLSKSKSHPQELTSCILAMSLKTLALDMGLTILKESIHRLTLLAPFSQTTSLLTS